nr:NADH dehydrogenase subunit 3 [Hypselosoma matsumurae]
MLTLMMMTMMTMMLSMMIMLMCMTMSKKMKNDMEKMSPFECGFDPKSSARMPFSIQFFLIAILFLIFDIEIVIILPLTITMKSSNIVMWSITVMVFIAILMLGIMHEWNMGILEWAK